MARNWFNALLVVDIDTIAEVLVGVVKELEKQDSSNKTLPHNRWWLKGNKRKSK